VSGLNCLVMMTLTAMVSPFLEIGSVRRATGRLIYYSTSGVKG